MLHAVVGLACLWLLLCIALAIGDNSAPPADCRAASSPEELQQAVQESKGFVDVCLGGPLDRCDSVARLTRLVHTMYGALRYSDDPSISGEFVRHCLERTGRVCACRLLAAAESYVLSRKGPEALVRARARVDIQTSRTARKSLAC